ncbi:hypothetical protein Pint_02749 [Pistacia integerrima]|uniref:Uncharacterized protein n=1 Tax=Pistacia integerrima TaxID=434235 RepID=A0ACC0ZHB5_9ROSI|nr:hypothetical protein Pint_02749 [Pistacia integerrima]
MENQEQDSQEQESQEQQRTHILVAVTKSSKKGYPNPSKRSRAALEWILENIVRHNVDRFNLQILHVQYPNASDEEYEDGVNMLEYFEFECHKIGAAYVAWIAQGPDPKIVICNEVERLNADLLVMGTGKLGSIRRFFNRIRGESASAFCLKYAECPVITVSEKATKRHIALQELRQTSSM